MANPTPDVAIPAWRVHEYRDGSRVEVTRVEPAPPLHDRDRVTLRSIPATLSEDGPPSARRYEEVVYSEKALPAEARRVLETQQAAETWPGAEVRTLVDQGPVANRINLTIVGDGYTAAEKDKFFQDAARISDQMFGQTTFQSYLPLFNVHAVFVPSNESGLSDTEQKDTALGLYRDPRGSKRAIMPGNSDAIDRAVALAPATDYPILVANDDFYGGLGGQYAITTRSPQSGIIVLRHELGHNFGEVGEEYDGGWAYMGANHSDSADVPWKPWVDGDVQAYDGKNLLGEYPWKNLKDGPLSYGFDVPKHGPDNPQTVSIDVSSVGWETPQDVAITVDGQTVPYQGVFTNDRSFFHLQADGDLAPGHHQITVAEQVHDGDNVLALIQANLYPGNYDFASGKVEAFPTFEDGGSLVGYRPTDHDCLMRDMRSTEFCAVDKESMWHNFLNKVSLIDGVTQGTGDDGKRFVQVQTPALQGLDIRWYSVDAQGQEQEVEAARGQTKWSPNGGSYRVRVSFTTPEVRTPTNRFAAQTDVVVPDLGHRS